MKIKTIKVKNIKNVNEFGVDLNGATVILTAGNNKGKTTVLRSLIDRLRGEKPELILKTGESEGKAELELTDGSKFEWQIKEDKEKLSYTTSEGIKINTVRDISKIYFPEIFDVDAFLQAQPKQQIAMLQKLAGIDFTSLDEEYKKAYEDRHLINRRVADEKSRLVTYDKSVAKLKKVDVDALIAELNKMQDKRFAQIKTNNEIDSLKFNIERDKGYKLQFENQITQLKEKIKEIDKNIKKTTKEIDELVESCFDQTNYSVEIDKLQLKVTKAANFNENVEKAQKAQAQEEIYNTLIKKSLDADAKLKDIIKSKKELLKKSNLPDGIEIDGEQILVNGLPFSKQQLGSALLYMTALKLASLQLGKVKTLYFDATMLDKNSLAQILKWAKENGLQLLIERADYEGGDIKYEILEV